MFDVVATVPYSRAQAVACAKIRTVLRTEATVSRQKMKNDCTTKQNGRRVFGFGFVMYYEPVAVTIDSRTFACDRPLGDAMIRWQSVQKHDPSSFFRRRSQFKQ